MALFRQRSVLRSPPVRRTPILHNFLHILSSRSSGATEAHEPPSSMPLFQYPGRGELVDRPPQQSCTQHLGLGCLCTRCAATSRNIQNPSALQSTDSAHSHSHPHPQPPNQSRPSSDRPSAFSSVHSGTTGSSLHRGLSSLRTSMGLGGTPEPSARLPGGDWSSSLLGTASGTTLGDAAVGIVGRGIVPPPRTSSSSVGLHSLHRYPDSSSSSSSLPIYTSATEGRGLGLPGTDPRQGRASDGTSSGHHPFYDNSQRNNPASIRNVLHCNLSRYFMEYERMQDLERTSSSREAGTQGPVQDLLSSSVDAERAGPSNRGSSYSGDGSSNSNLHHNHPNRCRSCHNLLTFNHDTQRWERSSQASSASAQEGPHWQMPVPAFEVPVQSSREESHTTEEGQQPMQSQPPVGLVYNQDTGQWERVYQQATANPSTEAAQEALNPDVPVDNADEDSLRRYCACMLWVFSSKCHFQVPPVLCSEIIKAAKYFR